MRASSSKSHKLSLPRETQKEVKKRLKTQQKNCSRQPKEEAEKIIAINLNLDSSIWTRGGRESERPAASSIWKTFPKINTKRENGIGACRRAKRESVVCGQAIGESRDLELFIAPLARDFLPATRLETFRKRLFG